MMTTPCRGSPRCTREKARFAPCESGLVPRGKEGLRKPQQAECRAWIARKRAAGAGRKGFSTRSRDTFLHIRVTPRRDFDGPLPLAFKNSGGTSEVQTCDPQSCRCWPGWRRSASSTEPPPRSLIHLESGSEIQAPLLRIAASTDQSDTEADDGNDTPAPAAPAAKPPPLTVDESGSRRAQTRVAPHRWSARRLSMQTIANSASRALRASEGHAGSAASASSIRSTRSAPQR
jgi:hypothetical protein